MALFDRAFAFVHVAATSLGAKTSELLLNLRAFAAGDTDVSAEGSDSESTYGIPGIFTRPRDPDPSGEAEYIAARSTDSLTPFAGRDLRISKARGNVNKGSIGIGGYGKAFLAFEDETSGGGNTFVLYVPCAFSGGVPTKAHTITVDSKPGAEQILILHKSGAYFSIDKDGGIHLISPSGQKFLTVDDSGISMSGGVKMATGALMGDVTGAKPVLVAPDSAGAWFGQVNAAIGALITKVNGGTASPAVPTAPTPVVSTKASASP